eukprot:5767565-Prymnesium_polylepis.1
MCDRVWDGEIRIQIVDPTPPAPPAHDRESATHPAARETLAVGGRAQARRVRVRGRVPDTSLSCAGPRPRVRARAHFACCAPATAPHVDVPTSNATYSLGTVRILAVPGAPPGHCQAAR